jgi:hypothetical protein
VTRRRRRPAPAKCTRTHCPAIRAHDTYSAYRRGCRSPAAIADNLRYTKLLNAGLRPHHRRPIGPTARRLQALFAIGWTGPLLSERCGITPSQLRALTREAWPWVTQSTARRVDTLFRQLWDQPGPSARGRAIAARKGYAPAAAYNDMDDMSERPKQVRLTAAAAPGRERRDHTPDIMRLTAAGKTANEIAADLRVTRRTVERTLERVRAAQHDDEAAA